MKETKMYPFLTITFSNSSLMGGVKVSVILAAASFPSSIASATVLTPNLHITESVSPYMTYKQQKESRIIRITPLRTK